MNDKERSDAILSALAGLNIREAQDLLYQAMDELSRRSVVTPPDASPAEAALMRMAAQLGENP